MIYLQLRRHLYILSAASSPGSSTPLTGWNNRACLRRAQRSRVVSLVGRGGRNVIKPSHCAKAVSQMVLAALGTIRMRGRLAVLLRSHREDRGWYLRGKSPVGQSINPSFRGRLWSRSPILDNSRGHRIVLKRRPHCVPLWTRQTSNVSRTQPLLLPKCSQCLRTQSARFVNQNLTIL
ncbi:hypothetical protein BDV93DRAFT_300264 [Ceratobasidium sp. AG-I]|nr:hypothetical protein BDV93DRAFT_300264 [Ceratobasidium sp. AG-I]